MNSETRDCFLSAVENSLQEMAFMFIDEPEEEVPINSESFYHASMDFSGPSKGNINLYFSAELSQELAGNILGELDEDSISVDLCKDALKELLNVICGEFVAKVYGKDVVVNLGIPIISEISSDNLEKKRIKEDAMEMVVEQELILLEVHMKE